jgi:hypothetical protein
MHGAVSNGHPVLAHVAVNRAFMTRGRNYSQKAASVRVNPMVNLRRKLSKCLCAVVGAVSILPNLAVAQTGTTYILRGDPAVQSQPPETSRGSSVAQPQMRGPQGGEPNRVAIVYVPPTDPEFQRFYGLLRERRALEKIQEILSPFRLPEKLTIKTAQCGIVNAFYRREIGQPTVTLCYELFRHILASLPKQTTPAGVTPNDAAVGQFTWTTLHEVGHATFDIFNISIFGRPEDAADNFATYILLQFGEGQARRLIGGAAWAWRAYIGDYKRNPVVPKRMAAFASEHGLPEERFFNLLCLAYGSDPKSFAEMETYLPPTRSPNCGFEYKTLVDAFRREIAPHIDKDMAKRVLDTNWLSSEQPSPATQK